MTSKESTKGVEKEDDFSHNSTDSSHGETYDDISYASGVHDSGLPDGFIRVDENVCRALYKPLSAPKGAPMYMCLNKASCRTKYGGQDHSNLRCNPNTRAKPGIYKGIYGQTGKLTAAIADSLTTVGELDRARKKSLASDRALAASMEGRVKRLDDDPYSVSDVEADLTVEEAVPSKSSKDKDSQLLTLMSSLMDRLDILEQNTTTHQSRGRSKKANPSILRKNKGNDMEDTETVSSTARKHAASTRKARNKGSRYEEEEYDEGSVGYIGNDDEEAEDREDNEDTNDDSNTSPPRRLTKKKKAKKTSSRPRLYTIACGRGGTLAIGLYRAEWDEISFIVEGFPRAKFRKVPTEKEGISFIRKYLRVKEIGRPKWMKEGKIHYPSISRIRAYLGVDESSDESSSQSASDYSTDASPMPKKKRPSSSKHKKMGVDPSMGKDTELFGLDVKNVNTLEKGLSPHNLGKKTASLFLEQIDDMAAYPRHSSHKTQEALGDFVEAVTDLNHHQQGRRGGVRDTGWKSKSRNSLDLIKNGQDLDAALSYLMEEQHTIMETCSGDLESVLVNSQVDDETAISVVADSLALRIGRDTLHSYMSLLNHLSSICSTRGWDACKPQIRHHAEKIGLIRVRYRHRLQMICKLYIYLRDGQYKNWMSMKLQSAEISSLRSQLGRQGGDGGTQGYNCSHCKSSLHGGGKGSCPWKDKDSSEAKKAAASFMVRFASGAIDPPTPPS